MNIPLSIHLNGNKSRQDDQKIGYAAIRLQDQRIIVRFIQPENQAGNADISEPTRRQLSMLSETPFDDSLQIRLSADASLQLDLKQLVLQLVVSRAALGTVLRARSEDICSSGVDTLSSALKYYLGTDHHQARRRQNSGYG